MDDNQQIDEMARDLIVERDRNSYAQKIYKGSNYKAQVDQHKGGILAIDIRQQTAALFESSKRGKVDFRNLEDVKARTYNYFKACEQAEVFPSIMGLASHGFGISRQALNQYLLNHPGSETTEFIRMTYDTIADILTNASLFNNANASQVIFQLKNHFGHSDYPQDLPLQNEAHEPGLDHYIRRLRADDPVIDLTDMDDTEIKSRAIALKYKDLLEPSPLERWEEERRENPAQSPPF